MSTTTNITAGNSKYMAIYNIGTVNQSMLYPLIKNDLSNKAYRADTPVTKLSSTGQVYTYTKCNGKLTNLGTNSSVQPYFQFDNSIAKYSTMFVISYYSDWSRGDGLDSINIENGDTGDVYTCSGLSTWSTNKSLLSVNDTSDYGNVLAIGIPGMSNWKTVRIKFNHVGNWIHAFVGFKSTLSTKIFDWESYNHLINKNGEYYSIDNSQYDQINKSYAKLAGSNLQGLLQNNNVNMNDIFTNITIGNETFKPYNKFGQIKIVKLKL